MRRGTRFVRVVFMPEMVFDIQRGDGKFVEAEKPQTSAQREPTLAAERMRTGPRAAVVLSIVIFESWRSGRCSGVFVKMDPAHACQISLRQSRCV